LAWHLLISTMLFWHGLFLYSPIFLPAKISERKIHKKIKFSWVRNN
jgi:hypothetical protein